MSKKNQSNSTGNVEPQISLGLRIVKALTEGEISQLLDVLFTTLSEEKRLTALAQLQPNTQETLSQIMTSSQTVEQRTTSKAPLTSLAKAAQTWAELWQEWNDIIDEAAQEEGKYIAQEARWEEPYFDNCAFVEDLEEVAERMKPLVKSAFKNDFNHDDGFALPLLDAESEISNGIPDWMDIHNGIPLEPATTNCLLQWEWLSVQEEGENGFSFVQKIREWEEKFSYISLEDDAIVEFCLELPDTQKQLILAGMTANKESSMWKQTLENVHSPWHQFYMEAIQSYAPEQYIGNLRATIPQQWENGLTVIEDLLAKREYQESLAAIQETFNTLLKRQQEKNRWAPETSLLYTILGGFHYGPERWGDEKTLLDYYQQTVQKLGETERVNALEIQQIAFDCCANWLKG